MIIACCHRATCNRVSNDLSYQVNEGVQYAAQKNSYERDCLFAIYIRLLYAITGVEFQNILFEENYYESIVQHKL